MKRQEMIDKIKTGSGKYDFIIIGGGATGIGILLEAITRGYSAILFESSDFTKSTSSKSTKLVHGGVRYLAQGNIGLVREACVERGRLIRNAPHIVKKQSFIIPVFSLYEEILYMVGLKFYDLLSGTYRLGRSHRLARDKTLAGISNLKTQGLKAGITYMDGQFEDSRLGMATLQTAVEKGGIAVNYFPVTGIVKNKDNRITAVKARDRLSNEEYQIEGKNIINATGVFADDILEMDQPGMRKTIQASQGIHLVISRDFLPGEYALMIPKTEDDRVLFAIPWLNKIVIGTTDTPIEKSSLEPEALDKEIDFILRTCSKYLKKSPSRKDVLSVFTGLRPLAANGNGEKTKEISRSHKIMVSASGLMTIIGGKWTTFRKMAEDLVTRAEKENNVQLTKSVSHKIKIYGYNEKTDRSDPLYLYGTASEKIRKIQKENGYETMISEKLNITVAEIIYAIRYEMTVKLEDILARRTRALLLDAREALNMAQKVAELMAKELNLDKNWIEKEVKDFQNLARKYIPEKNLNES